MLSKKIIDLIRANLKTYTMILALLIIWGLFALLTDGVFLNPRNLSNLFRQMTIVSFLAMGMVLVIVTGNIDLSVGSATGLVSAVIAYLQAETLVPIIMGWFPEISIEMRGVVITIIAILAALIVGLLIGLWQGTLIAYLGIPAFIVSLGGMLIFRGGVLGVTLGKTIVPIEDDFRLIAQGYVPKKSGLDSGHYYHRGDLFRDVPQPCNAYAIRLQVQPALSGSHQSNSLFRISGCVCVHHESVSRHSKPGALNGRGGVDFYLSHQQHQIWPLFVRIGRQ